MVADRRGVLLVAAVAVAVAVGASFWVLSGADPDPNPWPFDDEGVVELGDGVFLGATWSPDGEMLAVRKDSASVDPAGLHLADRGRLRRITSSSLSATAAAWQPDGTLLVAVIEPEDLGFARPRSRFQTVSPSGEVLGEVVPARPLLVLSGLAVSPDGDRAVAEIREQRGEPQELVSVDLQTGEVSPLHAEAMTSMTAPHFLADGRLVFLRSPSLRDGTVSIMVDEMDGSRPRAVPLAGLAVGGLTVADDGTALVSGHVDDPSADSHGIWRVDVTAAAASPERITTNAGNQPTIRPDGQAMVVNTIRPRSDYDLVLLELE